MFVCFGFREKLEMSSFATRLNSILRPLSKQIYQTSNTTCTRNIIHPHSKLSYTTHIPTLTVSTVNNNKIYNACAGVYGTCAGVLQDIWESILWAAPKSRRSIAKRRFLRSTRRLKPRDDIEDCVVCGAKKLRGRLCKECFSHTMKLTKDIWKKEDKLTGKQGTQRRVRGRATTTDE